MSEPLSDPPNRDVRGLAESASIGIHVRDEHPGDFVACRDGMCVEARRLLAASERPSWRELSRAMLADGTAEAAASERPPVDPLREALDAVDLTLQAMIARQSLTGAVELQQFVARALASPAVPRPEGLTPRAAYDQGFHHGLEVGRSDERENIKAEGLDVERLARAMVNVDLHPNEPVVDADRREAEYLAAEYQRLSDTGDTP